MSRLLYSFTKNNYCPLINTRYRNYFRTNNHVHLPIAIDCCDVIIFVGRTVAQTLNYDVVAILKII